MKLSKEYFGYLDSGKHIEKYYKHSQDKRIEPLKNRYKQNDFLHKLGNYSKGKEYFGYLDSGKHIEKYYKHSQDKRIEPLKNRYKQNDFLHKLGNYSKGKRADFFYEYLKEHKLTPEQRQKILQEVLENTTKTS